jgi:predicted acylesterase/phospholipase RssA
MRINYSILLLSAAIFLTDLSNASKKANVHDDSSQRPSKCYGIAITDGHDLGPYQAGAISGLLENLESDTKYTTVTGVSVGAINAYILSQYEIGQEKEVTQKLCII